MTAAITIQGVRKIFGDGDIAVHALKGVELAIDTGAFCAIAGPSGSGKTTLLNIVSGLESPTEGSVRIGTHDITAMGSADRSRFRQRHIGFVFQAYNLLPVLTAYENAEYVLMLQNVPKPERQERVYAMLERVGLQGMENRFPNQLSGGQQQRVAIARAIVTKPDLVLADEPTANVDSKTAGALLDLMGTLNEEEKVTFLFSSHDPAVIKRSKELIILKDGEVHYRGAPPDDGALG